MELSGSEGCAPTLSPSKHLFSNPSFFPSGSVTSHKRSVLFNHALPSSVHPLSVHNCAAWVDPITEAPGLQKSLFQHDYIHLFNLPCPFLFYCHSPLQSSSALQIECDNNVLHVHTYNIYIYIYLKSAECVYQYVLIFLNGNEESHCWHTSPCHWLLCLLCSEGSERRQTQITKDYKYLVWHIIFFKSWEWANLKASCLHVVWCLAVVCDCSVRYSFTQHNLLAVKHLFLSSTSSFFLLLS